MRRGYWAMIGAASVAAAVACAAPPAHAIDDAPAKPKKIDCKKPENKNKDACKPKRMSDDEIVNAAYWVAREGNYQRALDILAGAVNGEHPRVLTARGFAIRKLGDVDAAFPLYAKALEINPNYVQAREYLGEAYLAKGQVEQASQQLLEIEQRCGRACAAYTVLEREISAFKAGIARG